MLKYIALYKINKFLNYIARELNSSFVYSRDNVSKLSDDLNIFKKTFESSDNSFPRFINNYLIDKINNINLIISKNKDKIK